MSASRRPSRAVRCEEGPALLEGSRAPGSVARVGTYNGPTICNSLAEIRNAALTAKWSVFEAVRDARLEGGALTLPETAQTPFFADLIQQV